jgi:hypothetical protein
MKGRTHKTLEMNFHFGNWNSCSVLNIWDKNVGAKFCPNRIGFEV